MLNLHVVDQRRRGTLSEHGVELRVRVVTCKLDKNESECSLIFCSAIYLYKNWCWLKITNNNIEWKVQVVGFGLRLRIVCFQVCWELERLTLEHYIHRREFDILNAVTILSLSHIPHPSLSSISPQSNVNFLSSSPWHAVRHWWNGAKCHAEVRSLTTFIFTK